MASSMTRRTKASVLKDINPHIGQDEIRMAGNGLGNFGFLLEADDPILLIDLKNPELPGKILVHLDDRRGEIGLFLQVVGDHLHVVHLVDMVAGEDQDQIRSIQLQNIDVLVDGIGRPQIPILPHPLLGGDEVDEFVQLGLKMFHPCMMWRFRERDLYWVRRLTRRIPEFRQLLRVKSMMR